MPRPLNKGYSLMPKFRKRPVVIEAMQYTGDNIAELRAFFPGVREHGAANKPVLYVDTLEGTMSVFDGDWIIKGVKGEVYPCKPDIFKLTYEPV